MENEWKREWEIYEKKRKRKKNKCEGKRQEMN